MADTTIDEKIVTKWGKSKINDNEVRETTSNDNEVIQAAPKTNDEKLPIITPL